MQEIIKIVTTIIGYAILAALFYGVGAFLEGSSLNEKGSITQKGKGSPIRTIIIGAIVLLPILFIGKCAGCGGTDDMSWSIQKGK